jgi:hypothetical protein
VGEKSGNFPSGEEGKKIMWKINGKRKKITGRGPVMIKRNLSWW